ncbi:DNA topoisomerase IB [Propionivibrio soli]|uniref:DNA topoisomerase IB n=1 Tax=Propionivibrio soli TaxID=2976531 RepID=UPI0021E6F2C2|nr:DNA topoisomerase IB [Propionivibrio soli]
MTDFCADAPGMSALPAGSSRTPRPSNESALSVSGAPFSSAPEKAFDELPAGLVYVNDALLPGIRREGTKEAFIYRGPDGRRIRNPTELQRIRRLAIPPAYTDVWICPWPNGHLQATGRDARGRKQYRYHPDWNEQRGTDKFTRLQAFGRALPRIRRRVARDLAADNSRGAPTYRVVMATLVRLLDTTFVRIGNESYARENNSFGLTTLRDRHAEVRPGGLRLSFRGKHGVRQEVELDDPRIARIVRRCKQLPGQELFQYQESGEVRRVGSGDVNDYLAEAAGERFTAKDFRTWHATVQALELTRLACMAEGDTKRAFNAKEILTAVASRLGNTVAVCRKSYVHPGVLVFGQQLAKDPSAMAAIEEPLRTNGDKHSKRSGDRAFDGLQPAEKRLMRFLARLEETLPAADKVQVARPARRNARAKKSEKTKTTK